ncbi:hypothetical protein Tco_0907999 [Tanacetum coccineum]|uniref:Uncharacterized protein n=1 Tax=Tanacetum coccineum TaxID=301880 RepID=A0ABQ5CM09_9ASTR
MLTARKKFGPLPTHRLASRYPSGSSSSDSSSRHSLSDHAISDSLDDSPTAASTGPSRNRCRSPTSSVPIASPVHGTLSLVRSDLSPPPNRIRDSNSVIDLKVSSEDGYESYLEGWMLEMWLRLRLRKRSNLEKDTVEVKVDPRVGPVINDDVHESIIEDVPDHVTANGAIEVTYETLGDLVQRFHDHTVEIPWYRIFTKRQKQSQNRTKPSMRMERARENEAEGIFILNGLTRPIYWVGSAH